MPKSVPQAPDSSAEPRRAPVYVCPKCGAVADVVFMAACTQAEIDSYFAREQELAKNARGFYLPNLQRVWAMRAGLHGEHLACKCPRCSHRWRELPLDATSSSTEPTPIYDALVLSSSTTESGGE